MGPSRGARQTPRADGRGPPVGRVEGKQDTFSETLLLCNFVQVFHDRDSPGGSLQTPKNLLEMGLPGLPPLCARRWWQQCRSRGCTPKKSGSCPLKLLSPPCKRTWVSGRPPLSSPSLGPHRVTPRSVGSQIKRGRGRLPSLCTLGSASPHQPSRSWRGLRFNR